MKKGGVRTTVSLPRDFHRWLRIEALKRGITMSEFVVGRLNGRFRDAIYVSSEKADIRKKP